MEWRDIFDDPEADELNPEMVTRLIKSLALSREPRVLIVKFSAEWCRPCQDVKPFVDEQVEALPKDGVVYCELDIDETLELYMYLKNKRMVKGVPTILAWHPKRDRDDGLWYIPDDSVSGSDRGEVAAFFSRCATEARRHIA